MLSQTVAVTVTTVACGVDHFNVITKRRHLTPEKTLSSSASNDDNLVTK